MRPRWLESRRRGGNSECPTTCPDECSGDCSVSAGSDGMQALVAELRTRLATARLGGPAASRERHVARGKLLVRDRVDRLLDPGSPFLELSPLAATGM